MWLTVADAMELMGQEWVEDKFQKVALALVGSGVSKTYLSGLTQIVDFLSGEPGQIELMAAGLVNNVVPLGGLRNEIGKVFNPYMKELNREFDDQVRNRNQASELLAGDNALPIKYDILTGKPIRNWNLPTRLFNAFSPVTINPDYSPGRALLFNSGYDMRTIAMRPNGVDLSGEPKVRSDYQKALGDQNIQAQLDKLAKDPRAIESLEDMEKDKQSGRYGKEPRDYWVNAQIGRIFAAASQRAWNEVSALLLLAVLFNRRVSLSNPVRHSKLEKLSNLIVAMMLYKNYATCLNNPCRNLMNYCVL